jgi:hypothetical protein
MGTSCNLRRFYSTKDVKIFFSGEVKLFKRYLTELSKAISFPQQLNFLLLQTENGVDSGSIADDARVNDKPLFAMRSPLQIVITYLLDYTVIKLEVTDF